MTELVPLPNLLVEPIVRAALTEDLGRAGDITTNAVVTADAQFSGAVVARREGTIAGTQAALIALNLVDPDVAVSVILPDGSRVSEGDTILHIEGPARAVLTAERTALNLMCHLSGVATVTAELVAAVGNNKARITCTRKTTPNLRTLEKHAVRAGGGVSHRFGLDDGILIKDNHVALAGGIRPAIQRAKSNIGHMVKIEVEVDTLEQLDEALSEGVDAVLLDNMDPERLRRAVQTIDGWAISEASGRITADQVPAVAASGVDIISAGWITHSAPALDLGLDFGVAA
ncbi:MAG: carboxylating nicotinate-nucleotide diphosphorylase [Alphaproteobacteria bacterium]|jgi:nicotinate-nucleotide pyrophosphorylase (carboxylating)|nr:carboxylating nicotinate-nucleotide diphosphorylase [Alphaproteobacteria bacterium]